MITEKDATLVADALEAHGWDEWYYALLHAALDEGADPEEAVAAADEAWAESERNGKARAPEGTDDGD